MTITKTSSVETRHVLPDDERAIEQAVLIEIHRLFQNATGWRACVDGSICIVS